MAASGVDGNLKPVGYQSLTPTVATGLTLNTTALKKARVALIKAETQPVRWRDDGTDPAAAVGMLLDKDEEFWYTGDIYKIKFIDTAAGASTVHICLYR